MADLNHTGSRPKLQVIIGSTRPGRAGAAVGQWFAERADDYGAFDVELIDLAEVNLPLLDEPRPPRLGRYEHEHTRRWSELISQGNAYVFVVPEYNHGYNAATKNALDYLCNEWRRKPVGFVGYGARAGGVRAVQMLQHVVSALGMIASTESVAIAQIRQRIDEVTGAFVSDPGTDAAAGALLTELRDWTADLATLPERAPVPVRRARR
jgi:NAD(P)H-dependent FMN reductase